MGVEIPQQDYGVTRWNLVQGPTQRLQEGRAVAVWYISRNNSQNISPKWLAVTWRRFPRSPGKTPTPQCSARSLWVSPYLPGASHHGLSTSHSSSGSFPHQWRYCPFPRTSLWCRENAHPGPRLCLPPSWQITWPLFLSLRVVSPQHGC